MEPLLTLNDLRDVFMCSQRRMKHRQPDPVREWRMTGLGVTVKANTKSEARTRFKEKLDVSRLPEGCEITEVK